MSKLMRTKIVFALIALSSVIANASAQQSTPSNVQQESHTAAQLAASSSNGDHAEAATNATFPSRTTPAGNPASQSSDCVGPVSFCDIYFGS